MIETTTAPEQLDRSVLADICELNTPEDDVLGEVIALYLADAPGQVSGLAVAIAARQADAAQHIAHRLKGASLGVGASRMAAICSAIEVAAREQAIERAAVHAGGLAVEFESTRRALEQAWKHFRQLATSTTSL